MSDVSYLKAPTGGDMTVYSRGRRGAASRGPGRGRRRAPWLIGGGLALIVAVLAVAAVVVSTSKAKFASAPTALARVDLPLGGGSIGNVVATVGPEQAERFIPLHVKGDPVVYPARKLKAGETITLTATVRRPGWISWLSGKTERITRTVTVPTSGVRTRFVTLSRSGALVVHFTRPVRTVAYGPSAGALHRHTLASPQRTFTVPHSGEAGTLYVAATVQRWENGTAASVSWFPAGTKATAVAQPKAGASVHSDTPITLTFSKPISSALGRHLPTVSPANAGSWHTISSHAIRFVPTGYGYGLGQKVSIALPAGVRLAGATQDGSASTGTWNVPDGSTVRLQQMLAQLGYLPLNVHYGSAAPADTAAAQEIAAETPPQATLVWKYADSPSALKSQWDGPATAGELTRGALMRFQFDHDLQVTGYEDTETWDALFQAMIKHQPNTFGYTFVDVTEGSPESLFVWHSGKTVLSGIPVNTGVPGANTQTGTFAVFEHIPVTTMIGTNVNGSHYDDPGIKWVSYFNGGDALHYYPRGSYGYPQSNGCVEMDLGNAAAVYPFTPVGTIVQVNS